MNPRILKKLSKKADVLIKQLNIQPASDRIVLISGDEGFDTRARVDRKHLRRWNGIPNSANYFRQLSGTVGYGSMLGYYESEWSDLDAWTILREYIIYSFDDWENVYEDSWPENRCPKRVKANPFGILCHAKKLINTLHRVE